MKKALLTLLILSLLLIGCGNSGQLQEEADALRAELAESEASLAQAQTEMEAISAELEAAKEQLDAENEMDFGACCRMVYDSHVERFDELMLYDYLSRDPDEIFSDYDGSGKQCVSALSGESQLVCPTTNSVYYWEAPDSYTSASQAAYELVTLMLEEIEEYPNKTFDMTGYTVADPEVYFEELQDRYGLLCDDMMRVWNGAVTAANGNVAKVKRDVVEELIDQLFPYKYEDGGYGLRSDSLAIALGEDMWVFTPRFSYSFTGECTNLENSWTKNGENVEMRYPDTYSQYFILIKNGDVWRMQSVDGMELAERLLA